jgi:hypothetical protein
MISISEKKLAANRANGARSRGPKTPEGKARSAQNAVRHGLLAAITTLRNENKEAFSDHVQGYYDKFHPSDEFELGLVEEMAVASWHLRRAFAIETHMFDTEMDACTNASCELDRLTRVFSDLAGTPKLNVLHRYQTRLHNRHSRTLRDLIFIRKALPPSGGACFSLPDVQAQSARPASPEPSPLPNEPKSPFPLNESTTNQKPECFLRALGPLGAHPDQPTGTASSPGSPVSPRSLINPRDIFLFLCVLLCVSASLRLVLLGHKKNILV